MIGIIDTKISNVLIIEYLINKLGHQTIIIDSDIKLEECKKLILPGIGSFDSVIENLNKLNIYQKINKLVEVDKIKILGICSGMQVMCLKSDEGKKKGFGWLKYNVHKLNKIHMQWNNINMTNDLKNLVSNNVDYMYFTHNYYIPKIDNNLSGTTMFDNTDFCSILINKNIIGTQFHPEKSSVFGRNFMEFYLNDF